MLEVIGFIAIGYLIFKFAPVIIEAGFKFAVICLGFVAFLFICGIFATSEPSPIGSVIIL